MSYEPSAGMVSTPTKASGVRWLLSLFLSLVAGLVAAVVYAAITAVSGSEYFVLAVAVGGAVAFGWKLGSAKGILSVPVVAVISAACFAVAILAAQVGLAVKDGFDFSFSFDFVVHHPGEFLSDYFHDGFLSYVFAIAAVGLATLMAVGNILPDPAPAAPAAPQRTLTPGLDQAPGPGPLPPFA